jgi:hypothetical protein
VGAALFVNRHQESQQLTADQTDSSSPQVMVITSEGVFYSYAIDLENGGECVLQKSYSLLDGMGDDVGG